jgi:hypothetical protein
MMPEIQLGKNGCHFIKMGVTNRFGRLGTYHFPLAKDEAVSRERAERLWQLWLTQGEAWTDEGLKKAREIARGWDKWVLPF